MHKDLIISDEAESDLDDIWDYIAGDSPLNADRFIDQLYRKCLDIATFEGIGNPREELANELFSMPHKRYVIFFTKDEKAVSIVRILRCSRDLDSQFGS
jgi:plasmid stabilization system protein ParE